MNAFRVHDQTDAYASPWTLRLRVTALLWQVCWALCCAWTPKPFNPWRLFWLRRFGAKVDGIVFVHGRATIVRPWNLTMAARSCLGEGATAYCLDRVDMGEGSTLAQGAWLCTGTHDFNHPDTPLKTAAISVGAHAFIGLQAIVLPGVNIGAGCVVGAGTVVARDTDPWSVVAGNPGRRIGTRKSRDLP